MVIIESVFNIHFKFLCFQYSFQISFSVSNCEFEGLLKQLSLVLGAFVPIDWISWLHRICFYLVQTKNGAARAAERIDGRMIWG